MQQFVQHLRAAAECREEVMSIWRDMGMELLLLAYLIAWAAALLLTYTYAD